MKVEYEINVTNNNIDVVKLSDILILALTPDIYPQVFEEIKHRD